MSDATPTPDPDGAIYPDGVSGTDPDAVDPNDPRLKNELPQPPVTGESGTPLVNETPSAQPSSPAPPDYSRVTNQVDGEMLIANLLVEIANLTRRALVAETMVQMYQQAAQPKPAQ